MSILLMPIGSAEFGVGYGHCDGDGHGLDDEHFFSDSGDGIGDVRTYGSGFLSDGPDGVSVSPK